MASSELHDATQNNTDILAQMNSTYDAYDYLVGAVQSEQDRISRLDALARRDVYRLQGQSLGAVYSEDRSKFLSMLTRVTLFALMLVVAILSATSQALISRRTGMFLGISIVAIAGVVLIMLVSLAATRRNTVWTRFYWANVGITLPPAT